MNFKCCINCEKRHPGCHSHCEEYLQAKEEHDEYKAKMLDEKRKEYDYESRVAEINYRRMRRNNK